MTREPEEELIHHARSLEGLARALVGAGEAEDLVQDTVAQALGARGTAGSAPRSWRAWLGVVMRNLARDRRLAGHRREAREREHFEREAARRDEPTGRDAAVHRETIDRLHEALRGLPQPYQDTLLLRYFEGLTPSEIAARWGVSLSTVTSRLQRGLAQLRGRLGAHDERHGTDWRSGLVGAFGLGGMPGRTTTAASAVAIGAMLMTTKVLVGAALAAVAIWFVWPDGANVPSPSQQAGASRTAPPGAAVDALDTAEERGELVRVEASRAASVEAVGDALLTIVGRCVDEAGAPITGAEVGLRGHNGFGTTIVHDEPFETGDDGAFTIGVHDAEVVRVSLELRHPDRVDLSGSFDCSRARDGRMELGDLLLPVPCVVALRVVDEQGLPQAGVHVTLDPMRVGDEVIVEPFGSTRRLVTDDDGRGELRDHDAVWAGTFRWQVHRRTLLPPSFALRVEPGATRVAVELVVGPPWPELEGIVVDGSGAPVDRASVSVGSDSVVTGRDGRFVAFVHPRLPDELSIHVSKPGWAELRHVRHRDAQEELRLVVERRPGITVRVVGPDGSTPVERYAAWLIHGPSWPMGPAVDTGEHPDGVVHLDARPGDYHVCIEVPGEPVQWSNLVPVQLVEGVPAMRTVRMLPPVQRRVVVRAGGAPLSGARVDLADRGTLEVRPNGLRFPMREANAWGHDNARLVRRVSTDAQGAAMLEGPPGPLALVVGGDAVPEQVVQPVALDEPGDLVVDVTFGGVLRGALVPADVARRIRQLGQAAANRDVRPVGVRLRRGQWTYPPFPQPPIAIDDDGRFEVRLARGTYEVWLELSGGGVLGTATVDDGAVAEPSFAVGAYDPAVLDVRLLVDGRPLANAHFDARGTYGRDAAGHERGTQQFGNTDDEGRIRILAQVGPLMIECIASDGSLPARLRVMHSVQHAGEQRLDIDLHPATLELELVDSAGNPIPGRPVHVTPAHGSIGLGHMWSPLGETDEHGVLRVESLCAGSYPLHVWPAALAGINDRGRFEREHGFTALGARRLSLGEVVVRPGQTGRQRLVVPDAGR